MAISREIIVVPFLIDENRDDRFIFQAGLEVQANEPLVPRPNLRGQATDDWDERLADLQYRDVYEYAVGHGIATRAEVDYRGACHTVRTCWIPAAEVERVEPATIPNVELRMESLATLADGVAVRRALGPFVQQYRGWIGGQGEVLSTLGRHRRETAEALLQRAVKASSRIEEGIDALADPTVLKAFCVANRVMAMAARRRSGPMQGKDPGAVEAPTWRPQQSTSSPPCPGWDRSTTFSGGPIDMTSTAFMVCATRTNDVRCRRPCNHPI
jgi:hypothetical protein